MGRPEVELARALRRSTPHAERLLWPHLRRRAIDGHKFRRQCPVGPYVVDFACLDRNIVVELDGEWHKETRDYDAKRDEWLEASGFKVLRFSNDRVKNHRSEVLREIRSALAGSAG